MVLQSQYNFGKRTLILIFQRTSEELSRKLYGEYILPAYAFMCFHV